MNSDEDDDNIRSEKLPIYLKGKEIYDLVSKIADLIPENDEYLKEVKAWMLSDAAQLTVKVAGAKAAGLYDLKMENAAIIRKAARDLIELVLSTKTPTMTSHFMVLRKIPKNEKRAIMLSNILIFRGCRKSKLSPFHPYPDSYRDRGKKGLFQQPHFYDEIGTL